MTAVARPAANWLDALPANRLMAEMSLWSADLGGIDADMRRVETGTDIFHVDVADGHFVPSLLFFPDLVARLRRVSAKPFHIHLMVADAALLPQVTQFAEAGADLITVHAENANADAALAAIKALGLRAGLALQLHTPVAAAAPFLDRIDALTLLGTRLGVKGQDLAAEAPARLREARALISARKTKQRILLAADGGIREQTVPLLRAAGAETVVMGSLAFGARDFAARIAWARGLAMAAA
jgi:ribulose-phosphate 3-epimerase